MAKAPDTSLVGADLREADLRGQDLTGKVMFGADARGAKFYGAKVAISCEQWDGLKLDAEQFALLLLLISRADVDPRWQRGLRALVTEVCGDRHAATYQRYLDLA